MSRSSSDSENEQELRSHLEESPDDINSILELHDLLVARWKRSLTPEIKALAWRAVELRPDALTYTRLARIEAVVKDCEKAIEHAQKALSIDPDVSIANHIIAMCKLGPRFRKKKRREKQALYQEALANFKEEKRIEEGFEIPHGWIARVLSRGRLTKEAHEESLLALKHGKPGVLTKALMCFIFLSTNTINIFLFAGFLMYIITSFLLVGFFYSWGFVVSIPITVGLVSFSFGIRNRRTRGVLLATIISLDVVFIVLALLFWTGYRERAGHVGHPEVETQGEVEGLFDFSEVKEGYETPENTVVTWLKSAYEEDLPAVWRTLSDRVRKSRWNNDYDKFEKEYSEYLSEFPLNRLQIIDIKVEDWEDNPGYFKYTIYFLDEGNRVTYLGRTVRLIREDGQYRIDLPFRLV